jgi:hypothetical protein
MRADEKCTTILIQNSEKEKQLGRPRRRWEDNIKIYVEVGREGVKWNQ